MLFNTTQLVDNTPARRPNFFTRSRFNKGLQFNDTYPVLMKHKMIFFSFQFLTSFIRRAIWKKPFEFFNFLGCTRKCFFAFSTRVCAQLALKEGSFSTAARCWTRWLLKRKSDRFIMFPGSNCKSACLSVEAIGFAESRLTSAAKMKTLLQSSASKLIIIIYFSLCKMHLIAFAILCTKIVDVMSSDKLHLAWNLDEYLFSNIHLILNLF